MEAKIIDEMVSDAAGFSTQNESLERFAAKTLIKLTRIRDLRALLSKVTSDAKRQAN
jgi:3,4-dihydroxy-2-butanone 4-phosphate synthase